MLKPLLPADLHNVTAQNGFVNGVMDDDGHSEVDQYPADGPLQSGTNSLRRIKGSTGTKVSDERVPSPFPPSLSLLSHLLLTIQLLFTLLLVCTISYYGLIGSSLLLGTMKR